MSIIYLQHIIDIKKTTRKNFRCSGPCPVLPQVRSLLWDDFSLCKLASLGISLFTWFPSPTHARTPSIRTFCPIQFYILLYIIICKTYLRNIIFNSNRISHILFFLKSNMLKYILILKSYMGNTISDKNRKYFYSFSKSLLWLTILFYQNLHCDWLFTHFWIKKNPKNWTTLIKKPHKSHDIPHLKSHDIPHRRKGVSLVVHVKEKNIISVALFEIR